MVWPFDKSITEYNIQNRVQDFDYGDHKVKQI